MKRLILTLLIVVLAMGVQAQQPITHVEFTEAQGLTPSFKVLGENTENTHIHISIDPLMVMISTPSYIYAFGAISVVVHKEKITVIKCEEGVINMYSDELGNVINVVIVYNDGDINNYYGNSHNVDI